MPSGSTAKALIIRTGGKKIDYSVTRQRMSVGHYANAPRLDPVDYLRQAGREAGAPDQECLLDARGREWSRWEASDIDGQTREGESLGKRRIKRRVCCFDRSGFYSKSLSAPKVAT